MYVSKYGCVFCVGVGNGRMLWGVGVCIDVVEFGVLMVCVICCVLVIGVGGCVV